MVAARHLEIPFRFDTPDVEVFRKSDPTTGVEKLRIGGIITTARKDRAGQSVLPEGLDFSIFKEEGTFIDEHNPSGAAVVGVPDPDTLKFLRAGDKTPTGRVVRNPGWWVEGELFDDPEVPRGRELWGVQKALARRGRSLGFSVDGKIQVTTNGSSTVAKARVFDVAITRHPMNPDARMETLAKSMALAQRLPFDVLERALSAAGAGDSVSMPEGPVSGADGGGRVLTPEDLGPQVRRRRRRRLATKSDLTKAVLDRWPWARAATVGRLIDLIWET